jgi:hypothetical protein
LVEDAIQLFFDKCGERAISIEAGIEKLQWVSDLMVVDHKAIIELADRLERQEN